MKINGSLNRKKVRHGISTILVVAIVVIIVVAAASAAAYYLYFNPSTSGGIGTSSISLGQSSGYVASGNSMSVPYTVSLASGAKWGTSLVVVNNATITSEGITVTPSTAAMDPPFSGTLSISVSASTPPSTYQIMLKATGDDPSKSNVLFTLTVTAAIASSTTTTATSNGVTSSSAMTTTSLYGY